ncbi:hypothetical protein F5Y09DRAFT_336383 [Xylaria sp. FL1042]|nr:hypothetical protein F5Y09DRAFT_336383 [Xylaria sp. FL1042]
MDAPVKRATNKRIRQLQGKLSPIPKKTKPTGGYTHIKKTDRQGFHLQIHIHTIICANPPPIPGCRTIVPIRYDNRKRVMLFKYHPKHATVTLDYFLNCCWMSNPDRKFQALVKIESVVTSAVKLLHENKISYPILLEHVILIVDETNMSVDTIEVVLGQNSQAKKLEKVTQEDQEKQLSAVQDVFIRKTLFQLASPSQPNSVDYQTQQRLARLYFEAARIISDTQAYSKIELICPQLAHEILYDYATRPVAHLFDATIRSFFGEDMPLFAQDEKVDMICETLSNLRSAVVKRQKASSTSLPDSDNFSRLDSQLAIRFIRLTAYAAKDVDSCYKANEADWRALAKSLKHQVNYRDRIANLTDYEFDD